jgi:hypothetical protein
LMIISGLSRPVKVKSGFLIPISSTRSIYRRQRERHVESTAGA